MQLNYAVVHELVKEIGTPEAKVVLAESLLFAENRVVAELVSKIVELIGQRENMAHYGVFRDDPASTRVPSIVKSYCMDAERTSEGFLSLTNDCMTALRDRAGSQNLATGGYLLFADYINTGKRFLLVAMIKQRSGITMQGLVPTSITELDLSKLHQVARVAFDRLCLYEKDPEEQQDTTYVAFVSPKGNRQAAGYFVEALGCQPGTPAAAAVKAVFVETGEFFGARESIRSRGREARERLRELLQRKVGAKEHVSLPEIAEAVRRCFPLEEADRLSDEFVAYLQSESRKVPVPAEFPVPKSAVNRYTRFKYRGTQLTMEIDKAAVTREDGGPFYFDEKNRKLVISEEDFITKLSVALQDDE